MPEKQKMMRHIRPHKKIKVAKICLRIIEMTIKIRQKSVY